MGACEILDKPLIKLHGGLSAAVIEDREDRVLGSRSATWAGVSDGMADDDLHGLPSSRLSAVRTGLSATQMIASWRKLPCDLFAIARCYQLSIRLMSCHSILKTIWKTTQVKIGIALV